MRGPQLRGTCQGARQRCAEDPADLPEAPSSIINPGDTIVLPPQSKQVEHEAELVAVVGKRARNVTAEQAKKHIFGYTVGNDVTARDLQKTDDQSDTRQGLRYILPLRPLD